MAKKKKIDLNNEMERLLSPEVKAELDKAPPSPAFQQFLIRYLDVRDSVIINFIQDDAFAESVADKVRSHVAESYDQLAAVLLEIKQSQVAIAKDIYQIKKWQLAADERISLEEKRLDDHDKRFDKKREDIRRLQEDNVKIKEDFEKQKEAARILSEIKPTLETIQGTFRFWSWKNWWKIAGIILGIVALFIALLVGVVFYMHRAGWVTQNPSLRNSYEEQMKIQNAPTRAIHTINITGYAKDKKDSINDSGIQQNENEIEAGIKKRNEEFFKKYGHY